MMGGKDYKSLEEAGKRVAGVFARNVKVFLDMMILSLRDMQDEGIEGSDFDTVRVRWTRTNLDADMKALLTEIGHAPAYEGFVPELVRGGTEVKGMQPNQSLHRNDLPNIKCICLPFGEWTGKKMGKNGRNNYTRNKHGWLRRIFEPMWMKESSAEPMVLEFVLECWDNHGGKRPFASIAFTDFPELKRRLIAYGKENGHDLTDWDSIPTGKDAENYTCGDLLFIKNVWYVPLDLLANIARIVIIGDAPKFYKNGRCTVELQEERYQHLCDHAAERVSLEDLKREGKIELDGISHPVFTLLWLDAKRWMLP